MVIEKAKIENYKEEITVEEYGESIADNIYKWFLEEPTVDNANINDLTCNEITLLVKTIVKKLCDYCNVCIYDLINHEK